MKLYNMSKVNPDDVEYTEYPPILGLICKIAGFIALLYSLSVIAYVFATNYKG